MVNHEWLNDSMAQCENKIQEVIEQFSNFQNFQISFNAFII